MAVSYVRLSVADLGKGDKDSKSITNQIQLIYNYAKKNNIQISENYIDDGYSGINFSRPSFERLIEDVEKGKVDTIISKDISRLGREYIDTAYYITKYFPEHNVRFIAINDNYDSDNPNSSIGEILVGIKSIMNDRYVKETSLKLKNTKNQKRQDGNYMGFIAPYGYKIVTKNGIRTLEIDCYASKIVARIFDDMSNGISRAQIAKTLNDENIMTPSAYMNMTMPKNKRYYKKWSSGAIYRIVKNKTYTGNTMYGRVVKESYKSKEVYKPVGKRKIQENTHPAIVSNELYNEANGSMKKITPKCRNNYNGLFSGLVICGVCGRPMSASARIRSSGNKTYIFGCFKIFEGTNCSGRSIVDEKLKNIVSKTLIDVINKYSNLDYIVEAEEKKLLKREQVDNKIKGLNTNISIYNNEIRSLYLKKTTGDISLDEFIKLKNEKTKLKEKDEKLLNEFMIQKDNNIFKEKLYDKYREFLTKDEILKYGLRELISEIVINKNDNVVIKFKFSLHQDITIDLY